MLLSGAGSDGVLGLGAIRENDGLTLVQSPDAPQDLDQERPPEQLRPGRTVLRDPAARSAVAAAPPILIGPGDDERAPLRRWRQHAVVPPSLRSRRS